MTGRLPEVIHTYQNHHLDSTRWRLYRPREDDIIISTAYKSGTTWMQAIVLNLVFLGKEVPLLLNKVSPWLDVRWRPVEETIGLIEAQQHRRFLKSHLALDGLPYYPRVKYIVVGRDARDVAMSLWNHYSNYKAKVYRQFNETPGLVGDPLPACPGDIHPFWHNWITRGWFAWESEGYPFWGNLHHTRTWWEFGHLDNILFVHYNDLLADVEGEITRVARFLDIDVREKDVASIAHAVSFSTMKEIADKMDPGAWKIWKNGGSTFFFKGTNGRWKGVLADAELELYRKTLSEVLPADCGRWLEQGRIRTKAEEYPFHPVRKSS
jgi:aryl sulfotransferase